MKSKIKKKSSYLINICLILLIFNSVSITQALVSADRTIEKNELTAGSETFVTVIIKNDNTPTSIALEESIPLGWSLTRISDDADVFKNDTNVWIWFNNTDKNVKYRLNIPPGTAPGTYIINGKITTANTTTDVTGYNTIKVSGGSSGGSSGIGTPTIAATSVKSVNVTGSRTETVTAQPTVTIAEQTSVAPIGTAKDTATTNTKLPGFSIITSIGIIAAIYVLRRMK